MERMRRLSVQAHHSMRAKQLAKQGDQVDAIDGLPFKESMSRSRHYGALSDEDDDEALVAPATATHDDPFDDHVISRSLSGKAPGHFVSPEASSANLQQQKTSGAFARAGSLGRATDKPLSMQDKLQGQGPAGLAVKDFAQVADVMSH